jgi:hypothetical protein
LFLTARGELAKVRSPQIWQLYQAAYYSMQIPKQPVVIGAIARLMVNVDLPTPPLRLTIAIFFMVFGYSHPKMKSLLMQK